MTDNNLSLMDFLERANALGILPHSENKAFTPANGWDADAVKDMASILFGTFGTVTFEDVLNAYFMAHGINLDGQDTRSMAAAVKLAALPKA